MSPIGCPIAVLTKMHETMIEQVNIVIRMFFMLLHTDVLLEEFQLLAELMRLRSGGEVPHLGSVDTRNQLAHQLLASESGVATLR
jgi:hypothetical protein